MRILVLGSGGREHAFCWLLHQSKEVSKIFVAPGNAGTGAVATTVDIDILNFEAVKSTVLEERIDMVLAGPEAPLVEGIHDFFLSDEVLKKIAVIGPQKEAATLEGSKAFAKAFMSRHKIPTAAYQEFTTTTIDKGYDFLETLTPPYVLKADGLAAGKGVLILEDLQEAKEELRKMLLESKFGKASQKVVIEEFLSGMELSCFVLTDGTSYKILPLAKDYKRIGAGDTGLNTGGMGAVSPVPFADEAFQKKIEEKIIRPTIEGLQKDNLPYKGFVFIGLIKVGNEPKVIEYNVRMGDPETQVVLPRLKTDFGNILKAIAEENLDAVNIEVDSRHATTVIVASEGYPEAYEKGKTISGLESSHNSIVFHAGTKQKEGKIVTNGGRVLAVTSLGNSKQECLETSYETLRKIEFEGIYYRKDIGFDL